MSETLLRFVQISDTHISADPHYNQDGAMHTPMIGAKALVHQINTLPFTPDFVLHTGDVAYNPDETAYPVASEILGAIEVPVYYLAGNHDDSAAASADHARQRASRSRRRSTTSSRSTACRSSRWTATARRTTGAAESATSSWRGWKAAPARKDDRPLIVTLHHNVLPMGSVWWDEWMRLENGEDFHRALLPARDRIRGVFSGHVHQNTDIIRDGIAYFTAKSSWSQIHNYPDQTETEIDRFSNPGYSIVTVTRDQTYVRRCTFIVEPIRGLMKD